MVKKKKMKIIHNDRGRSGVFLFFTFGVGDLKRPYLWTKLQAHQIILTLLMMGPKFTLFHNFIRTF